MSGNSIIVTLHRASIHYVQMQVHCLALLRACWQMLLEERSCDSSSRARRQHRKLGVFPKATWRWRLLHVRRKADAFLSCYDQQRRLMVNLQRQVVINSC